MNSPATKYITFFLIEEPTDSFEWPTTSRWSTLQPTKILLFKHYPPQFALYEKEQASSFSA